MKDRIVALGFLLFALVFLAGSLPLKVGTPAQPGAGFMPAVVGVGLLVAAAYNLLRVFRAPVSTPAGEASGARWTPWGIAAATFVYPVLLSHLHYLVSTFVVMAAMLLLLRFKSPWVSVLSALAGTLVSFIFFGKLLSVVLPSGVLEDAILAF
jgi:putative tricarboxylic transport membrane protein